MKHSDSEDDLDPQEEARLQKKLGQYLTMMTDEGQAKSKSRLPAETGRPRGKQPVESNRTVFVYMANLVLMIVMAVAVMGVLIIFSFFLLEGSQSLSPWLLVHLLTPALTLALNLYVMTLDDSQEYRFFKRGMGGALMNFALGASTLLFVGTTYLKFGRGRLAFEEEGEELTTEKVLNVEECSMYLLAVGLAGSLKKYSEYKLEDLVRYKKSK